MPTNVEHRDPKYFLPRCLFVCLFVCISLPFQKLTWREGAPVSFQTIFSGVMDKEKQIWPLTSQNSDLNLTNRDISISELLAESHYKHLVFYKENRVKFFAWSRNSLFKAESLEGHHHQMLFNHTNHVSSDTNLCGLMTISNLARPQWLTVSCVTSHISDVVCAVKQKKQCQNLTELKSVSCSASHVLRGNSCFLTVWTQARMTSAICTANTMKHHNFSNISELSFLTKSILLSPLLSVSGRDFVMYEYNHILRVYQVTKVAVNSVKGFQLCTHPTRDLFVGGNIQKCPEGNFVSVLLGCTRVTKAAMNLFLPDYLASSCANLFSSLDASNSHLKKLLCDRSVLKSILHKDNVYHDSHKSEVVSCGGKEKDSVLMNDLVRDCYPSGEDEPILQNLMLFNVKSYCTNTNQVPCLHGHSKCFNISQICAFQTNRFGYLLSCRNGAHLTHCRTFQCNMMYKCCDNYCIPWEYICNNRWDCPGGEDEAESCQIAKACKGGFKCKNVENRCIHLRQLCDETENCPFSDDEELCSLHSTKCPDGCNCFLFLLKCDQYFVFTEKVFPYKHIIFSNAQLNENVLQLFQHLSVLKVSNTSLAKICFPKLSITYLIAIFNNLQQIGKHCFHGNLAMNNIQLVSDQIVTIMPEAFSYLPLLRILNLSYNCFSFLPKTSFHKSPSITVLSLLGLTLLQTEVVIFELPELVLVESVKASTCCAVSVHTRCSGDPGWKRKCESILPGFLSRSFYCVVSILILLLNVLSAALHIKYYRSRECLSIVVFCVNCSEMLWGIYLGCLFTATYLFPVYCFSDNMCWQSSFLCHLSSTLSLSSKLLSPVFLCLLSTCRMFVTIHPFHSHFKEKMFVLRFCQYIGLFCLICSVSIGLIFGLVFGPLPSVSCLSFVAPGTSMKLVRILTIGVFSLNFLALTCISFANCKTWVAVCASKREIGMTGASKKSQVFMLTQFILMGIFNFLSWIGSNSIYIIIVFTSGSPKELLQWTLVSVSSSDSLVHPVILSCAILRAIFKQ